MGRLGNCLGLNSIPNLSLRPYTYPSWDKDRNGFLAKDAKTEIPIEPNNTVSFIEPILSKLLRTYLVNVSLGYIPTRVSTALADVKKGCLVGRDALAQGEVDGMAFPVVSPGGGKQPVACIVPGENHGL